MKKIVVLSYMLVSLTAAAGAQDFRTWAAFHAGHQNHTVLDRVEAQLRKAAQKPAWMQAVERQVHKANPTQGYLGPFDRKFIPAQKQPESAANNPAILSSVDNWQRALAKNELLQPQFAFVKTPRPQDVEKMDPIDMVHVALLLLGVWEENITVKEYAHYMVSVELPSKTGTSVYVLFNCYAKEVYVVTGDLQNIPGIKLEELPVKTFQR